MLAPFDRLWESGCRTRIGMKSLEQSIASASGMKCMVQWRHEETEMRWLFPFAPVVKIEIDRGKTQANMQNRNQVQYIGLDKK